MKYILFACLAFTTLLSTVSANSQSTLPIIKPKIVGGQLAEKNAWPWMAALVSTSNEVSTSLEVAGTIYVSSPFSNSPSGQASATMADCGIGDNKCDSAAGKICLIARGEIDFSIKVDNCQNGGGIGAIIFNNALGDFNGTLGENFSGTIPVVAISQSDGSTLLNSLGSIASINISTQPKIAQSADCGASFIGEQWVLTAAHCVVDANINLLKVNVGEYDLRNGAENAIAIKRIYIHPEYNEGASFNNDIALIELVETIDNPAVTLVDLNSSRQLALDNAAATVIGWGNVTAYGANEESPPNSQPDKLRQVELSLLSNEQCKDKLAQAYTDLEGINYLPSQVGITDSMICAEFFGGGKGSCQGDSGGPLLVNTNQGWQQIGIVSYGVGCADAAFPDVYARVGKFTAWINSLTKGIAIEPNYDFAITPQYTVQTSQLTVTNNSDFTANLTFSLIADKIGSTGFSLTTDDCTTLVAKQSCQIQLAFDAKTVGQHKMRIVINSDNENIPTSESFISAQAIAANNNINTQLSNGSNELLWFSGGDQPWLLDNSEAEIFSGDIADDQQSAVMLTFTGAGSLSFYWSVSSEENTDDPSAPYDALYLIIDGEQVDFISGKIAYTKVTIDDLVEGDHQVTWLYLKDGATSAEEDKGYLKDVIFTPDIPATDIPATDTPATGTTQVQPASKSSGGSVYYILMLVTFLTFKRRRS